MVKVVSYSEARANLSALMDHVTEDCEPVTITRRGKESVVMVSAVEYNNLMETLHNLTPAANGLRLLQGIEEARRGEGGIPIPDLDAFIKELGRARSITPVRPELVEG